MPVTLQTSPEAQLIRQPGNVQQRTAAQGDLVSGDRTGTFAGRQVSVDNTHAGTTAPGIRQSPIPQSTTFHRVAVAEGGFVNRPGSNRPAPDMRKAGRLARLGSFLKTAARRLIQQFFHGKRTASARHTQAGTGRDVSGQDNSAARGSGPAEGTGRKSIHSVPAGPRVRIKPDPEAGSPTVIKEHSPDPVAPGKAFYREKQKDSSGLCGMHALNAFCGGPVIGKSEFFNRTVEFTAPRLDMQPEEYRNMIAGERFDCSPEAVGQILSDMASAERADASWNNTRVISSLKMPDPATPAHQQMIDRINTFPGDRLILGYAGGHGSSGHFVALRRDAEGKWQEVNSLDYVNRPKDIPDLGRYITQKSGVSLIHAEADFSFTEDRPATPGHGAPAGAAPPAARTVSELVRNHPTTLLAEAARKGVDASRNNVATQVLGENNSMEDARRVLTSGDGGIRRATTALTNVSRHLKPETLPAQELQGTAEQWSRQTGLVAGLANRVAAAEFNENIKGDFTQYGTTQNNPFEQVVEYFPEFDHGVRNWLAEGIDLTGQLLSAQERATTGQPPLTDAELDDLQQRVDRFTDSQARARGPVVVGENTEMDMGDTLAELDRIYEAGKTPADG